MRQVFRKGRPALEIVTSRQWWIRTLPQAALLDLGRQLRWHPAFMRARYEDWVTGLNSDCWSAGSAFSAYLSPSGTLGPRWRAGLFEPPRAGEDDLPVDPTTDVPPGYSSGQRGVPGGFTAEMDVMDTWATSSLTPQIAGGWEDASAGDRWQRIFPMDLRPQGHDIIRTWLFSTIVALLSGARVPSLANAAISGWILDPTARKCPNP